MLKRLLGMTQRPKNVSKKDEIPQQFYNDSDLLKIDVEILYNWWLEMENMIHEDQFNPYQARKCIRRTRGSRMSWEEETRAFNQYFGGYYD